MVKIKVLLKIIGILSISAVCLIACGPERVEPLRSVTTQRSEAPTPVQNASPSTPHLHQTVVFTVISNGDPVLGEQILRDPSGLLWGSLVRDETGELLRLNAQSANEYCLDLNPLLEQEGIEDSLAANELPAQGYFLPRRQDFERIRAYMGAQPETPINLQPIGFEPQTIFGFGMLSMRPSTSQENLVFDSRIGVIAQSEQDTLNPFRCVALRGWVESD